MYWTVLSEVTYYKSGKSHVKSYFCVVFPYRVIRRFGRAGGGWIFVSDSHDRAAEAISGRPAGRGID